MKDAPLILIVKLSGDLPDTRLALLTRQLGHDLFGEGLDARTVYEPSELEQRGGPASVGTLAIAFVTSRAVRALIASLQAYLAREPALVIKIARADGVQL